MKHWKMWLSGNPVWFSLFLEGTTKNPHLWEHGWKRSKAVSNRFLLKHDLNSRQGVLCCTFPTVYSQNYKQIIHITLLLRSICSSFCLFASFLNLSDSHNSFAFLYHFRQFLSARASFFLFYFSSFALISFLLFFFHDTLIIGPVSISSHSV